MNHASIVSSPIPLYTDTDCSDWLEDLRYCYEQLGRELDLFTTRESDSHEVFRISDEIEIELILLFSALDCDLSPENEPSLAFIHSAADRLRDTASWLDPKILFLMQEDTHERLTGLLQHFQTLCSELSSHLWWRWLATEIEPWHLPTRLRKSTSPQAVSGYSGALVS